MCNKHLITSLNHCLYHNIEYKNKQKRYGWKLKHLFAVNAYSIVPRIVNGETAVPGSAPYQVSLQWGIPPFIKYRHICGGSVLNEQWILTAGHCITMGPKFGRMRVAVGKHVINKNEESEQTSQILSKIVHPDYPR